MKQISLFDDIFVDSFAGGGGASTGIELAVGRPIDIAINHDQSAIMMHKRNHPYTEHYREDIWQIDPKTVTRGRHVRLAWFSPDCKHFSRAKGAALVDRKIRGLAWVVLRWAGEVKPDVIMVENVPEFVTWGPVRKGKPVKSRSGETYRKWYKQLQDLGYVIETRKECAADFGAPTIRTRFYLIARCDGKPIVWPERTHAPRNSLEVKTGLLKPWRSAAEIIDWSLPCYSIFESKKEIKEKHGVNVMRPLKENTLRRIARGLDKFVLKSGEPFIVPIGYGENKGQKPRLHDVKEPVSTVVSSTKQYVCMPHVTKFQQNSKGQSVGAPYVMSNNANNVPHGAKEPVPTITTGNRNFMVTPYLAQCKFDNAERDVRAPFVIECNHSGDGHNREVTDPLQTITAKCTGGVVAPTLIQYHTEKSSREVRGQGVDQPIYTVDAADRYGLAAMHLTQYFSGDGHYHSVEEPLATITTMEREGVTAAYLSKYFTGVDGADANEPLPTVTAVDHNSLSLVHLAHFKGQDKGQHPSDPLMTVTQQDGQFAQIVSKVIKWDGNTDLLYWPQVRELLNTYCDYHLKEDEILLLRLGDSWYFISDIGLRMLTPRELYNAMGFPPDYIIDRDAYGKPIVRSAQVARCGNAVCPAMAEALVRANLPECCPQKITTMEELDEVIVS